MSPVARGSEDRDRGFSGKVVRSSRRQAGGLPCDRKAGRDSPGSAEWRSQGLGSCPTLGEAPGLCPAPSARGAVGGVPTHLRRTEALPPRPRFPPVDQPTLPCTQSALLPEEAAVHSAGAHRAQRMLPARGHSGEQTCPRAQSSLCGLRGAGHRGQVRCLCVVREVEGLEPLARRS